MIGRTVGHYRIEAKLGSGGMGAVYRAVDIDLARPAAIKVLHASALSDPERKERFVQEAKAGSALNHSNIVTVYEIGTTQVDGESIEFIAMEYVDGRTLDKMIGSRQLTISTALGYAAQIAGAVAAAHGVGIIHRDLKPGNVMVTDTGKVKVLDFGLAKLTEPPGADAFAPTESIHIDSPFQSEVGTIVGTVEYMSPEQAEGKKLDVRSDIFSFGALLYEMLTGQQAFPGTSKLSRLSAIISREPEPVTSLAEGVPKDVEKLIARCLRKDPNRRWQTMADLKVAIEELSEDLQAGRLSIAEAPPRAVKRNARKKWLSRIAGVLIGLLAGGWVTRELTRPVPVQYQRLTYRNGDVTSAKFAPDGNIIYSARWDGAPDEIFLTRPGNREARPLGVPEGRILSVNQAGDMAVLTGDGSTGTLVRIPFAGGAPREVLEGVSGADWAPDGATLAVVRTVEGVHRLEYPSGTVLYETDTRPPYSPRISPDGTTVAFFAFDTAAADFEVTVIGKNRQKTTLSRGWRAVGQLDWSPDGKEIWFSAGAVGEDPAMFGVDLSGRTRFITQTSAWIVLHDVSPEGRVLLGAINSRLSIRYHSSEADKDTDLSWLDASCIYGLSDDGKSMVFSELSYGQGRNTAIYFRKTDGSDAIRLGFGNRPALSPDGNWVASIWREEDGAKLLLTPTGPGESRTLGSGLFSYETVEWFPDSKRILFTGGEPGQGVRTYVRDLDQDDATAVTEDGVRATQVSPDGRLLLIVESQRLYVRPVLGGERRFVCDLAEGESVIRWQRGGQHVFLAETASDRHSVKILRAGIATGRKETLYDVPISESGGQLFGPISLSADGSSYAYSFQRDLTNLFLVDGLR